MQTGIPRAASYAPTVPGERKPDGKVALVTGGGSGIDVLLAETAKTERVSFADLSTGAVDVTTADFLVSNGRGIDSDDNVERFKRLTARLGADISATHYGAVAALFEISEQLEQHFG